VVLYCKVLFVSLHLCVGVFCVGVGAYVLVGVAYIYVCVRIRVYARVFACAYVCMQFLSLWLPRSLPISDARSLSLSASLSFSLSLSVREEDQKLNRLMPAVKNFASLVFSFALSHTVHTEEERGNLHAQAHVGKRQCPICLSCMPVRKRTPSLLFSFCHAQAPSIARMLPLFSLSSFFSIHCPSSFSKPTRAFARVLCLGLALGRAHDLLLLALTFGSCYCHNLLHPGTNLRKSSRPHTNCHLLL